MALRLWNTHDIPKPHSFTTTPLTSFGPEFITVIVYGCAILIPKSSLTIFKNYGISFLMGLPLFVSATVLANPENNINLSEVISLEDMNILDRNISEINILLTQLNTFIDSFNNFVNENPFNVVMQDGELGVDTDSDVTEEVAQNFANRINILNNLIHHTTHQIESLLETINSTESLVRNSNSPFDFHNYQYERLLDEFNRIMSLYNHWS